MARLFRIAIVVAVLASGCSVSSPPVREAASSGGDRIEDLGSGADERTVNAAAVIDRYVITEFPEATAQELSVIQLAINAHCLGVMGLSEIQQLPFADALANRVVEIDASTCDEVVVAEFMIQSEPTGAATWKAAVAARHEQIVWWGTEAEFAVHAERICTELPSRSEVDPFHELSASATVELIALMQNDECALLHPPTSTAASTVSLDAVAQPDHDIYVFFGSSMRNLLGDRITNLHRLHVASGDVVDLTDTVADGFRGVGTRIGVSPDGGSIAYIIDEAAGQRVLYVSDLEGNRRRVGEADVHDMAWSSDSSEVFISDGIYDEDGWRSSIEAISIVDGSRRVVVRSDEVRLRIRGASDGFIYAEVSHDEPEQYRFVRLDESDGAELGAVDVGFARWDVGPTHAIFSRDGSADPGTLGIVPLNSEAMTASELPTAHGHESAVRVSPDGRFVAYRAGPENDPNRIVVAPMDDPSAGVELYVSADGLRITVMHWTPDSRGIVFRVADDTMHLVALDGTIEDLDIEGTAFAIRSGS